LGNVAGVATEIELNTSRLQDTEISTAVATFEVDGVGTFNWEPDLSMYDQIER
jgi:hypothetical protein